MEDRAITTRDAARIIEEGRDDRKVSESATVGGNVQPRWC
jgi:hypothetical protein